MTTRDRGHALGPLHECGTPQQDPQLMKALHCLDGSLADFPTPTLEPFDCEAATMRMFQVDLGVTLGVKSATTKSSSAVPHPPRIRVSFHFPRAKVPIQDITTRRTFYLQHYLLEEYLSRLTMLGFRQRYKQ